MKVLYADDPDVCPRCGESLHALDWYCRACGLKVIVDGEEFTKRIPKRKSMQPKNR